MAKQGAIIVNLAACLGCTGARVLLIDVYPQGIAIGRDVRHALASCPIAVLEGAVTQRVLYAEAAAQGKAVFEFYENGPA